jgi:hypothetical protein
MDIETRVSAAIKKAVELVESLNIKDSELRRAAMGKCFDALYAGSGVRGTSTHKTSTKHEAVQEDDVVCSQFWGTLAESVSLKEEDLHGVYDLTGSQIIVSLAKDSLRGETAAEKQRYLAALVLLAYEKGLKKEWVPALLLAEAAKHVCLYDEARFGQHIMKDDWIRPAGAAKGRRYKLSATGVKTALEYLRELAKK